MKKSILPLAVAVMLIPQLLISQDSMDISNDLPFDLQEEVVASTDLTPKGGDIKEIANLKSFELVDESESNLRVLASFNQKESFEVKIFNKAGFSIYEESFETDDLSLAMGFSNLPQGEYYISITTKDGELIKPFK